MAHTKMGLDPDVWEKAEELILEEVQGIGCGAGSRTPFPVTLNLGDAFENFLHFPRAEVNRNLQVEASGFTWS